MCPNWASASEWKQSSCQEQNFLKKHEDLDHCSNEKQDQTGIKAMKTLVIIAAVLVILLRGLKEMNPSIPISHTRSQTRLAPYDLQAVPSELYYFQDVSIFLLPRRRLAGMLSRKWIVGIKKKGCSRLKTFQTKQQSVCDMMTLDCCESREHV